VNFNERISIAGEDISDDYLFDIMERCKIASKDIPVTFFEGTTIGALLAFSENQADVVMLETGLGGRLDATNVVESPLLTIITPISIDHQAFLGNTIEDIAAEKAGIIKKSVPCIVSKQSDAAATIIKQIALNLNSTTIDCEEYKLPFIGLKGKHQRINASTAVTAIKSLKDFAIVEDNITIGLKNVEWKGRLQKIKDNIWIDGGHNLSAAEAIRDFMSENNEKPWHLICGFMNDKDANGFLNNLSEVASSCNCIAIPNESNSFSPQDLHQIAKNIFEETEANNSIDEAISKIENISESPKNIMICGSLYLVGYVLAEYI